MSETTIEARGVVRRFGTKRAVDGLDLTVPRGCIYGLLGRNGAGKTTLLRMLAGLIRPNAGDLRVRGVDPWCFTVDDRYVVGYVPERLVLPPMMRVEGIVRFCRSLYPVWDSALVDRLLGGAGIQPRQRIKSLSLGAGRMLTVALAFAHKPDVLLLDEPAGGLDVVARREFLDALLAIFKEETSTVLFSTHILTDVERVADHVGIMVRGRMSVSEPLDRLKETVKRVRAHGTGLAGDRLPPGTLRAQHVGDELLATVRLTDEAALRGWAAEQGCAVEIQDLSLEDIFVELAQGNGDVR